MTRVRQLTAATLLVSAAALAAGPTEFPPVIILNNLPPEAGCGVEGQEPDALLGRTVSGRGDYNADGIADFLVGASGLLVQRPPYTSNHAYVLFGQPGLHLPQDLLLQGFDGANGFDVPGESDLAGMGFGVATAGDLNGDEVDDLALGSPFYNLGGGRAYVIFGREGLGAGGLLDVRTLDGTNGFMIDGIVGWLGNDLAGVGDMNGDGYADLAVGATSAQGPAGVYSGRVFVLFGGPQIGVGGFVDLSNLHGGDGFVVNGLAARDAAGLYVRAAGDVNGDRFPDMLISAPYAHYGDPQPSAAGQVYVVFGGADVGAGGVIEPVTLDGTNGFIIEGVNTDDRLEKIGGVGDVNADGVDDFALGDQASCYVIFGHPGVGAGGSFDLNTLDGQNGARVPLPAGISGSAVRFVPGSRCDLNHDGYDDLVVGFPLVISAFKGEVFVFFGGPGLGASGILSPDALDGVRGFTVRAVSTWYFAGAAVASAGDVNADGVDDLLIGTPEYNDGTDYTRAGRFDVLFGRPKFGDFDRDRDVDMADFMDFVMCYNGPLRPPAGSCPEGVRADFDNDGDVDLTDYAVFAQNYTGAR